jgi:hypothetical protein
VATTGCCIKNKIMDWRNYIFLFLLELVLFMWVVAYIRSRSSEILRRTRSLIALRKFYLKIFFISGVGVTFGLIKVFYSGRIFGEYDGNFVSIFIGLNVTFVSLIFLIWMYIAIRNINRRMRF